MEHSISELEDNFYYDPLQGKLYWLKSRQGRSLDVECGSVWRVRRKTIVGIPHYQQYRAVSLNGKRTFAQNIIWALVYGDLPSGFIVDHRDGDGLNNRIENLRLIPSSQNSKNMATPVTNTSGICGVRLNTKTGMWTASITSDGKKKHLGTFREKGDAMRARRDAERELGFYKRHGRIVQPDRKPMKFFHMP